MESIAEKIFVIGLPKRRKVMLPTMVVIMKKTMGTAQTKINMLAWK
jgi:hypothetical protein